MELEIGNSLINNIGKEQNNFLQTTLGKAINSGLDLGIRFLLPSWAEDKVIELKDNLFNYGLKDGISKTIQSVIDTGKAAIGVVTGNFENVNQINEAVKKGGIIDSVSDLLDGVFNKIKESGKVNSSVLDILNNGKESLLDNIQNKIETVLTEQILASENLEQNLNNWKLAYENKDFPRMEKEYIEIKDNLKKLAPIENIIKNAKQVEDLHNLIKNKGQDFNLSQNEISLINSLNI